MKILLTGGTGYIGSQTAVELLNAGHEIVIIDNLSNSQRTVVDAIEKISGKKIDFVHGDIRDKEVLKNIFNQHAFDAVIHFAGLKAVGESVRVPLAYFDNNVGGTIVLLQAMDEANVRTLVFSSSATVYGNPQYLPIDEDHPTSATNPYGRTKLHIEEMLSDLTVADASWRIACLRYFNPVGAHKSGLIGEDPSGIPNNLMPFIARVASGKLPILSVFGNDYATPDGTGVRDYIHVSDLALGHEAALNFLKNATDSFNVFNLGTGNGYSVLEMIKAFEHVSGVAIPFQFEARRAGDVAAVYALADKARELLNWKAELSLQDMCSDTWLFQKNI